MLSAGHVRRATMPIPFPWVSRPGRPSDSSQRWAEESIIATPLVEHRDDVVAPGTRLSTGSTCS